jgi:Cdc6-like AAA superfamily ATPase
VNICGRTEEQKFLTNEIMYSLTIGEGNFIYMCGLQGTGKTLVASKICAAIVDNCKTDIRYVCVNMQNYMCNKFFWKKIAEDSGLEIKSKKVEDIKSNVLSHFKTSQHDRLPHSSSKHMTILFIDDIDKVHDALKKDIADLLRIAGAQMRRLIVPNWSNADFVVRPTFNSSSLIIVATGRNVLIQTVFRDINKPKLLIFVPNTRDELLDILKARIHVGLFDKWCLFKFLVVMTRDGMSNVKAMKLILKLTLVGEMTKFEAQPRSEQMSGMNLYFC